MSDTANLMARIRTWRQQLDQDYFNDLRELRQQHGDRAVDQALATLREQREAVATAKPDWRQERRGPRFHYRERG